MQEQPHKRFQDLSPKAERAWEPSENSATNAPAVESPIKSKKVPQPRPETADINPAREHLKIPNRAATLKDRRRSLGASLALHLAVGTTWLSLPEPQPSTPDLTRLEKTERLDALGDTIQARIERMADTDEHNREMRAELERERHAYFDRLIDTALNPESPEYKIRHGIPPIEAFAHIDAITRVEALIASYQDQKLDPEQIAALISEYEENLLSRHKENIDVIMEHGYPWTGDVRKDFPTLQEALFQGHDRYFYNPGFSQTLYRQDQEQFDEQLTTGIVNCQVARMTPMVLYDIYERANLPKDDLANVRVTRWNEHRFSGYQERASGDVFTLMEGAFGTPVWKGTHPPSAEDPGVSFPAAEHLAYYITRNHPTPEQSDRLRRMRYTTEKLGTFSDVPIPDRVIDFGSYGKLATSDGRASERIARDYPTDARVELEPALERSVKSDVLQAFHTYIKAHPVEGGSSSHDAGMVTLPPWLHSHAAREILPDYVAFNYDSETTADVYRALVLDGARSRDLLERIRERLTEVLKARLESRMYSDILSEDTERWSDVYGTMYIAGPFGPSMISPFKSEPWFLDAIDAAMESDVQALPSIRTFDDPFTARELTARVADKIAFLDRMAKAETREHETQDTNPFAQRARRLERALIPYQDTAALDGFTPTQIASMPRQQLRDVIARSTLSDLIGEQDRLVQQAYFDRLAHDPDLYVFLLERLTQFEYDYSYREGIDAILRLGEPVSKNTRLRSRLESATRGVLQKSFYELERQDRNNPYALSALLAFHHEIIWLRPIIEVELRRVHTVKPLSDFSIHYAGLQRFGLEPTQDTLPHGGARELIDYLEGQDFRMRRQYFETRNAHIDLVFKTAYHLCENQQDRITLLWTFSHRTHLPPPVSKDELFPEDLAVITALSETASRPEGGFTTRLVWQDNALDLKPYYAPQTIDIVRELRQNPGDPSLSRYQEWADMNPDLGLQYVEQWIAFQESQKTP